VSDSLSPTCRNRPSASPRSTTSVAPANNGSRRARARPNGRGCHGVFRRQRRPPSAPRARLQPWQLHAHAGDAEGSGAVVADQPAREADQDRCQGRQPRPLRHLPIDRGSGVATDGCGNLVADWSVARPSRASVSGGEVICDERRRQRSAFDAGKATSSRLRGGQPAIFLHRGSAAIEFRCDGNPVRRKIIRMVWNPGNVGLSSREQTGTA
jgi:hypothetical protein